MQKQALTIRRLRQMSIFEREFFYAKLVKNYKSTKHELKF